MFCVLKMIVFFLRNRYLCRKITDQSGTEMIRSKYRKSRSCNKNNKEGGDMMLRRILYPDIHLRRMTYPPKRDKHGLDIFYQPDVKISEFLSIFAKVLLIRTL